VNNPVNVIDLCAGCGGLSTGFEQANFNIVLAIEKDISASETYSFNHPNTQLLVEDITKINDITQYIDCEIDGVIGGVPCQSFSISGTRDPKDPRGSLFMDFMRITRGVNAKFFVMENVTGMLSLKTSNGEKCIDIILKEMTNSGYNVSHFVLNAAEFGVPQSRKRLIFIGIRKDLQFDENLIMPKGFLFDDEQITIAEAISDLPQILACEGTEIQDYQTEPMNEYQKYCRKNSEKVFNHIAMKHTKRLVNRFEQIKL
jgi:DNA (cytosine-5)-methyltransferase 1